MSGSKNNPRKKLSQRKRRSLIYTLATLVFVCVFIVLAVTIFFKMTSIEISGSTRLSQEDILNASDIKTGSNLFRIDKSKASQGILSAYPFIEKADISIKLPNTLKIELAEAEPVGALEIDGEFWLIDKNAKVLESVFDKSNIKCAFITGISIHSPVVGKKLVFSSDESQKFSYLTSLLNAISDNGITSKVTWIDLSKTYDIYLQYNEQFDVSLGAASNLNYKINYLIKMVDRLNEELGPKANGTIEIGEDNEAHFIPQ